MQFSNFLRLHFEFPIFFICFVEFCIFSENFWWKFVRISRQIPEKSDVCRFFNQICENKLENCRKFWNNMWKLFIIIHYYSFVSLGFAHRWRIPLVACARDACFFLPAGRTARQRWRWRRAVAFRESVAVPPRKRAGLFRFSLRPLGRVPSRFSFSTGTRALSLTSQPAEQLTYSQKQAVLRLSA